MTKLFLIAATMLSAVTSPALARDARPAAASTETATSASSTQRAESLTQRYCVIDVPTGSHIRQKTCQTRQQWLDQGMDPLAKQ